MEGTPFQQPAVTTRIILIDGVNITVEEESHLQLRVPDRTAIREPIAVSCRFEVEAVGNPAGGASKMPRQG
jgi:hypothetical protein